MSSDVLRSGDIDLTELTPQFDWAVPKSGPFGERIRRQALELIGHDLVGFFVWPRHIDSYLYMSYRHL